MLREILFYVFAISAFVPIYKAYKDPAKMYELPFLYGFFCYIFIIPTLFIYKNDIFTLTDSEYNLYLFNAIICFWAALWGYGSVKNNKLNRTNYEIIYNKNKMFFIIVPYFIIGVWASIQIDPSEFGNVHEGIFVIYIYLSRLLRPAAVIIFTLFLLKPDTKKALLLLIFLFFSLQFIIVSGRRSEIFNLVITVIFPLFFIKKKTLPKTVIIPAIVIAVLIISIFPIARQYTKKGEYNKLQSLPLIEIAKESFTGEKGNEVIEAAHNMEVIRREGTYFYGVTLYNEFVHQFVSSTLFGKDVKESFKIKKEADLESLREKYFFIGDSLGFRGYLAHTGFANTFFEFGYFAFILFYVFGRITKIFYLRAIDGKDLFWVLFYCCFSTFILLSIYHSIISIFIMIIPYLIILYHTKWFSKKKKLIERY